MENEGGHPHLRFQSCDQPIGKFAYEETEIYAHAWKIAQQREEKQFKCEVFFLMEALEENNPYDLSEIIKLADAMVAKAIGNGKKKAREAFE